MLWHVLHCCALQYFLFCCAVLVPPIAAAAIKEAHRVCAFAVAVVLTAAAKAQARRVWFLCCCCRLDGGGKGTVTVCLYVCCGRQDESENLWSENAALSSASSTACRAEGLPVIARGPTHTDMSRTCKWLRYPSRSSACSVWIVSWRYVSGRRIQPHHSQPYLFHPSSVVCGLLVAC